MKLHSLAFLLTLAASLVACGGGGGGGGTPVTPPITPPTAEPSANASGTVVDEAADTPLSGVQVSLAAWTAGATPNPVATTSSTGTFSFTTVPGSYLLVIGSNSPTATTATLHMGVILNSGANTIVLPTPSSYPDVTWTTAQSNGSLRLMALSTVQQDCLTGANAGRTNDALPLLVPDEFLEEDAAADLQEEVAQNTDTPSPLWSYTQPFSEPTGTSGNVIGLTTSSEFDSCYNWTGPPYSYVNGEPPYPWATASSSAWYGADWAISGPTTYGSQMWNSNVEGVGTADKNHSAPTALGHSERIP